MSRTAIKQFGRLAGYLAVPLALVLAIGLLATRRFEPVIVVGFIILLAALAIFAATNPEVWQRQLGRQRISSSISGIVVIIALAGIIALVNILMQRTTVQFDLTSAKNFTISDTSTQVLEKLNQPVKATIFFNNTTLSQQQRASDLLKQYAARNDKLAVDSINADVDPLTVARYNIKSNPAVVFEQGQRKEEVSSVDEQTFTRALLRLQNPVVRRVLIVTGHQELSSQPSQSGNSLQAAVEGLTGNNYTVEIYNSATGTTTATTPGGSTTPTPTQLNPANDILLVAGPRGRFSDDEKTRITTFLKQGGKALFAYDIAGNIDQAQSTNINDLLADYNVKFSRGVVVETNPSRRNPQNPTILVPEPVSGSPLNENLQNQNVFVIQSTAIEKPTGGNATFTEVLKSSADSYLKVKIPPQTAEFEQGDLRGPVVVAATLEEKARETAPASTATAPGATPGAGGVLTTTTTPGTTPTAAAGGSGQPLNTRIVLLGSSSTFSDLVLSQSRGNFDFFVNAMNYLNESSTSIVIPSRISDNRPFSVNETQSTLTFWSAFLGLPLLILFLGLAAWWRRQ